MATTSTVECWVYWWWVTIATDDAYTRVFTNQAIDTSRLCVCVSIAGRGEGGICTL